MGKEHLENNKFSGLAFHRKHIIPTNNVYPDGHFCMCGRSSRGAVRGKRLLLELLGQQTLDLRDHGCHWAHLLPPLSRVHAASVVVNADRSQSLRKAEFLAFEDQHASHHGDSHQNICHFKLPLAQYNIYSIDIGFYNTYILYDSVQLCEVQLVVNGFFVSNRLDVFCSFLERN